MMTADYDRKGLKQTFNVQTIFEMKNIYDKSTISIPTNKNCWTTSLLLDNM